MAATKELVQKIVGEFTIAFCIFYNPRWRRSQWHFRLPVQLPPICEQTLFRNVSYTISGGMRLHADHSSCVCVCVCVCVCGGVMTPESKTPGPPKGRRGAKSSAMAAKVALMKLKLHATGDKGLPQVNCSSSL